MAGIKLTEKDPKTSGFALADVFHLVDISDTTSDPQGTSYKVQLGHFLSEFTWINITVDGQDFSVLKKNGTPVLTNIENDDWVIMMTDTRLVVGVAKTTITLVSELDDSAKFARFIDASPLL